MRHRFRHGAEILADHDAVIALALQRENRDQILERIVHIRAVWRRSGRAAPTTGDTASSRDRSAAPRRQRMLLRTRPMNGWYCCARSSFGILRRNAPVLSFQRQRIGRRADRRALQIQVTIRPGFRAGRIRADRHVAIQADRHAAWRARAAAPRAAARRRATADTGKYSTSCTRSRAKRLTAERCRIPILLRPARPAPVLRSLQTQMRIERVVDRVQAQRLALCIDEAAKRRAARRVAAADARCGNARTAVRRHLELGAPRRARSRRSLVARSSLQHRLKLGVGDATARRLALGEVRHVLDRDVQHVQELAARRTVRADVRRIRPASARAADSGRSMPQPSGAASANQLTQIAKVAHAPVARRAQRIQLHRDAPHALAGGDRRVPRSMRRARRSARASPLSPVSSAMRRV